MRLAVPVIILSAAISMTAHAQMQLDPAQKVAFRNAIEKDIKAEFDTGAALLNDKGTAEQRSRAINGVKSLLYNKAYNTYRCGIEHLPSADKINTCVVERTRHLLVNLKMADEYLPVLRGRSRECELQAR